MQCDAALLGRHPVEGQVDSNSLAAIVKSLVTSGPGRASSSWPPTDESGARYRRFFLRCRDRLEIVSQKRQEDEGFESDDDDEDDDASSTKSAASFDDSVSNASSCCFVEDHVYHGGSAATTTTTNQVVARNVVTSATTAATAATSSSTDSANSSGASDTDEVETAVNRTSSSSGSAYDAPKADGDEVYSITDVAFCHTDPAFPRVVVLVVKKRRTQRLAKTGADTSTGLEAIVFQCPDDENLRRFCSSFHEVNRRVKLDQYKHPHRRKDTSSTNPEPKLIPYSKTLPKPSPKPMISVKNPVLLCNLSPTRNPPEAHPTKYTGSGLSKTLPKPSSRTSLRDAEMPAVTNKYNLVQRTDGDGVTHIEVSRGLRNATECSKNLEKTQQELVGPSSIISISTPDIGNLMLNASSSSSSTAKSRFCKEIEGVIRSDVDVSPAGTRQPTTRQRQPALLVLKPRGSAESNAAAAGDEDELHKVWTGNADDDDGGGGGESAPKRPERRKYTRRPKPQAPQPPIASDDATKSADFPSRHVSTQQKIVRGQFVRVAVDQQSQQPTVAGNWLYGSPSPEPILAYPVVPSWRLPRCGQDPRQPVPPQQYQHYDNHRRPAVRPPMAYRYIDTATSSPITTRFFGLSQKLKEIGGNVVCSAHNPYSTCGRRKNNHINSDGHLKSVIKKNRKFGETCEPKKVTFSAYATVQMVD